MRRLIAFAKNAVVSVFAAAKGRAVRQAFFTWLTLLAVLLPVLPLAAAPAVPGPAAKHFYVLDEANVLSEAAEYKIQALSSQLAAKTNAQVVVVTVRSLQGEPLEDYALTILRQWGIGGKQENNGLLMLVAVDDRRSRIEVGYGLEGILPDAKTGRIQDEYMLPFFKNGEYEQGILNGYTAIANEVAKEYNVTLNAPPAMSQKHAPAQNDSWAALPWWGKLLLALGVVGLIIMDILFFDGRFTLLLLSIFFRGGRGGGGSGGTGGGGSGGGGGSSRDW